MNSISPYFASRRIPGIVSLRRTEPPLALGLLAQVYYLLLVALGWGVLAAALLKAYVALSGA
jgi:hypothetical protein